MLPEAKREDLIYTSDVNQHAVFVLALLEYVHGGTTPIAEKKVPYGADACAIDPATGDLAVSGAEGLTTTLRSHSLRIRRCH